MPQNSKAMKKQHIITTIISILLSVIIIIIITIYNSTIIVVESRMVTLTSTDTAIFLFISPKKTREMMDFWENDCVPATDQDFNVGRLADLPDGGSLFTTIRVFKNFRLQDRYRTQNGYIQFKQPDGNWYVNAGRYTPQDPYQQPLSQDTELYGTYVYQRPDTIEQWLAYAFPIWTWNTSNRR